MKIIKNQNKAEAQNIIQKIKDNEGYCPCRLEKTEDTKCICKNFREQNFEGWCHCGLYCKVFEN